MTLRAFEFAVAVGLTCSSVLTALPTVKIYVEEPGVYRLAFEALPEVGVPLASASLRLTCGGEDVPIWVGDGGDGTFGPGDHLEFVGEQSRRSDSDEQKDVPQAVVRNRFHQTDRPKGFDMNRLLINVRENNASALEMSDPHP